jgi:hypothetical protein
MEKKHFFFFLQIISLTWLYKYNSLKVQPFDHEDNRFWIPKIYRLFGRWQVNV